MKRLVLASGSRYRAQQLETLGLEFETCPTNFDEAPLKYELPQDVAIRLSLRKARAAAREHPQAIIIGSDQVAELDDKLIGKPGTTDKARQQLQTASGHSVRFFTGLCVLDAASKESMGHTDRTTVQFRTLQDAEIDRYLEAEHVLDCAGSFKCEGLGISLFDAIQTQDPSALIGLPLIALARMLREYGYAVP